MSEECDLTRLERDLEWLVNAPPLMGLCEGFPQFQDAERATLHELGARGLKEWLQKHPSERKASLNYEGWRVGLYFEALVESWIGILDGWEVLASNLVVKKERQTLGAFDLVVKDPDNVIEHWELAIKYYLGFGGTGAWDHWVGPNQRDRLNRKMNRMIHHQLPLSMRQEGRSALEEAGLPQIQRRRALLLGLFFTEWGVASSMPDGAFEEPRGRWVERDRLGEMLRSHPESRWAKRNKPDWIGDMSSEDALDEAAVLERSQSEKKPEMWSRMIWDKNRDLWTETERWFFVPTGWRERGRPQVEKN